MLTREQILDAFKQVKGADATEYVLAVGRAVEKAAHREAMEQIAQWLEISDAPLTRREAAHAIRELMESGT